MFSSQSTTLTANRIGKSFFTPLLIPKNISKVVGVQDDQDFADVFGSFPSPEVGHKIPTNYDPVNIYQLAHSLVDPPKLKLQEFGKIIERKINHDINVQEFEQLLAHETVTKCVEKIPSIDLEDFEVLKLVGEGAFGKVYQVRKKDTSKIYAMKVMRKDKIMKWEQAESIKVERDILTKIQHPFIVQLRYSFQTKYRIYLVLDFMNGRDLVFQLNHQGLFREDLARVYAAEIVSAVSHLHANGIMHRDLKPGNILLDADGHVMVTDFGLAKQFDENTRSYSICGTTDYMFPEIILSKGYDKAADWWSVGILLFEMLSEKTPFCGRNGENIQKKIVKDKTKLPSFLTSEAHSILKGLLQKDPSKRLGNGVKGSEEVKSHKWFKGINWKKLEAREIKPSFKPKIVGIHCIANFDKKLTDIPLQDSPASSPKITDTNNPFKGFTYHRPASTLTHT